MVTFVTEDMIDRAERLNTDATTWLNTNWTAPPWDAGKTPGGGAVRVIRVRVELRLFFPSIGRFAPHYSSTFCIHLITLFLFISSDALCVPWARFDVGLKDC